MTWYHRTIARRDFEFASRPTSAAEVHVVVVVIVRVRHPSAGLSRPAARRADLFRGRVALARVDESSAPGISGRVRATQQPFFSYFVPHITYITCGVNRKLCKRRRKRTHACVNRKVVSAKTCPCRARASLHLTRRSLYILTFLCTLTPFLTVCHAYVWISYMKFKKYSGTLVDLFFIGFYF